MEVGVRMGVRLGLALVTLCALQGFSDTRSKRVRLNEPSVLYAQELIGQNRFIADQRNSWSEHQPSAGEENEFIRQHGFSEYAKWHLGIDERHSENTKARYKFPFGDFKNVHRCGLLAVKSRAREYYYSDIESAAAELLEMISSKKSRRGEKCRSAPAIRG